MKESSFFENEAFDDIFFGIASLIDRSNLIYSHYCIKINDTQGQIISELLFDSFIYYYLSTKSLNKKLGVLFQSIFVKENKKKKK